MLSGSAFAQPPGIGGGGIDGADGGGTEGGVGPPGILWGVPGAPCIRPPLPEGTGCHWPPPCGGLNPIGGPIGPPHMPEVDDHIRTRMTSKKARGTLAIPFSAAAT